MNKAKQHEKMRHHNVCKRRRLNRFVKMSIASKFTEMRILIYYILNSIRFVLQYSSPKVNTKDKLEKELHGKRNQNSTTK